MHRALGLRVLGTPLSMRLTGASQHQARAVAHAWSRCLSDEPADASATLHVTDLEPALAESVPAVTLAAIDARAGSLWMLHAACLADPATGAAIALVGPSGTGKTTLVAALGGEFGYLSDETAGIEADGRIAAYPKPLSIRTSESRWKSVVSPDDAGLLPPPSDCRLARVALLNRCDATVPDITSIRTAEALVRLAEHTSRFTTLPRPLHTAADHLERTGGLVEISYREAAELGPALRALVASP